MKKILFSLAALMMSMTASVMTSCSNDIDELAPVEETEGNIVTLTITLPEPEATTRVGIDNALKLTGWETNDIVTLYTKDLDNVVFTCTDANTGTFTGTLPEGKQICDYMVAMYGATLKSGLIIVPNKYSSDKIKDVIVLYGVIADGKCSMKFANNIIKLDNVGKSVEVAWVWTEGNGFVDYYGYFNRNGDFKTPYPILTEWVNVERISIPSGINYIYMPMTIDQTLGFANSNLVYILPHKTFSKKDKGQVGKLFNAGSVGISEWENQLSLGKYDASSIRLETRVDVSGYVEDDNHKKLNSDGTLWEVLDGTTLKIQTPGTMIKGHDSFGTGRFHTGLFEGFYNVESITGLGQLDMSEITDMSYMFYNCKKLSSISLNFNTSSVTNMQGMFMECTKLEDLNLSSFNTSKVTNMYQMFYDCSALTNLNLSSFDTSIVTDMSHLFENCTYLGSLTLSNTFNVSSAKKDDMFKYCGYNAYNTRTGIRGCVIYGITDNAIKESIKMAILSCVNSNVKFDGD